MDNIEWPIVGSYIFTFFVFIYFLISSFKKQVDLMSFKEEMAAKLGAISASNAIIATNTASIATNNAKIQMDISSLHSKIDNFPVGEVLTEEDKAELLGRADSAVAAAADNANLVDSIKTKTDEIDAMTPEAPAEETEEAPEG